MKIAPGCGGKTALRIRLRNSWVIVLVGLVLNACAPHEEPASPDHALIPEGSNLEGWTLASGPETYVGDELFQLINGGAELYHEFGFRQVHAAEYELEDRASITLELFEMVDAEAAFGVFSIKRGDGGRELDIADGCVLQDYYLNLWTGPHVLTLTGMAPDAETRQGLERIARATVELSGGAPTRRPQVVEQLAELGGRTSDVVYLRGDLALANLWSPAAGVRFFPNEGAAATVGDHRVVLLSYSSPEAAGHHLEAAADGLIGTGRFELVDGGGGPEIDFLRETEGDGGLWFSLAESKVLAVSGPDNGVVTELRAALRAVVGGREKGAPPE
jgi:hypothetical protein